MVLCRTQIARQKRSLPARLNVTGPARRAKEPVEAVRIHHGSTVGTGVEQLVVASFAVASFAVASLPLTGGRSLSARSEGT
ncbi:hypothetical protein EYF80_048583 [Liparis tanakae]|uniref:Uncharacterized protein n=1 Tax=Liparis tanakae TaxID=230148 RepID=A0A4Z2FJ81_9TELE|nr:hypothetical protein EYF80_048583 [Liparis tanakae]